MHEHWIVLLSFLVKNAAKQDSWLIPNPRMHLGLPYLSHTGFTSKIRRLISSMIFSNL
ncbi:MAG: hypothetical protein ACI9P5_003653 [Saprospiraceae bacterium]|jgi:hypothetical protein